MAKATETKRDALAVAEQPQQKSLLRDLATQYGLEPEKFMETMKATILPPNSSNEQLAAFLIVAKKYNLNPFVREIFAFPGKGGGIVPVVSVDGWITMINRQENLDGIEFVDETHGNELAAVTCKIYRKDRAKPVEVTEYMDECRRDTDPWKRWPSRMLRHKALIQCARYAFGLAGVYDEDEAERIADSAGRRTIDIGGSRPETAQLSAGQPAAVADEELALRDRVHDLCEILGYNRAKEQDLLGRFRGRLSELIAQLQAEHLNGGAIAPKPRTEPGKNPPLETAGNGQTGAFGF